MGIKALLTGRTRTFRSFSVGLFALLLAAAGILAASGKWTSGGPPPSWTPGSVTVLAVDSLDPNLVFAGTSEGVYRSRDGGGSWEPIDNGIPQHVTAYPQVVVEALVADPSRPGNLYVGLGQGYVNNFSAVGGFHKSSDSGSSWRASLGGGVSSIAIDPANPDVVYASSYGFSFNSVQRQIGVFRSTDAGASWSNLGTVSGVKEVSIAVDPTNSANVFAVDLIGDVSRSSDSGVSWATVGVSESHPSTYALSIDPFRPSMLLVGTKSGLFRSLDSGRTFQPLPSMPRPVLTLNFDTVRPQRLFAGTDSGLFQSTDGGESFEATPLLAGRITSLAISPSSPSILSAAADGSLWRSDDGGATWRSVGTQAISRVTALAADPTREGHLIASVSPNLIFESQNAGASWTQIGTLSDFVSALTFDPTNPETLYAAHNPGYSFLPCTGMAKSQDGGRTWGTLGLGNQATGDQCALEIAVDGQRKDVVYALGTSLPLQNSIFKSTDAGLTWTALKLPGNPFSFVLNPGNSTVLYAATSDGLARSSDGGLTWLLINTSLPLSFGTLLIDRSNPQILYARTSDGLFKSLDAGSHWQQMGPGPQARGINLDDIVLDPQRSSTLYAGGAGGVLVSQDSGASWEPFEFGLPNTSVSALAIEPSGRRLHAGTVTHGVFDYEIPLDRIPLTKPPTQTSPPRKIMAR